MRWNQRDKAHVWHPFTQMKSADKIIAITKAKNCTLTDEDGNDYIDAISSWWVNIHGHSNKYIADAVYEQLQTLEHVIFAGFTHPAAIELSERLLKLVGKPMNKIFFSDNGSTAVEVALKMALQYWWNKETPKYKVIALEDAYHGDTFGAMSVGARSTFSEPFDKLMFNVAHVNVHNRTEEDVLSEFEEMSKDAAAFIYEPLVQGAGGMLMYSESLLEGMIKIAKSNDVLCIADEVMTGFGRTGKMFASEYSAEKPDIMSISKGITGGTMALGLTLCSDKIYDAFLSDDKKHTFYHGHSYTANPIACSASLASMDLCEREDYQENMDRISHRHSAFIASLDEYKDSISNIRQRGTIVAFDIRTKTTGYFSNIRDKLYYAFLDQGVLLRPLGNTIYIMPPMVITNYELDQVYSSIFKILDDIK